MKKLKVGIIGLGRIASLYELDRKARKHYPSLTHAGAYTKHAKTQLISGSDIDMARLNKFRKMWGNKRVYRDYRAMLRENKLDILSICTHPDAHYEIIKYALGFVKVIFCEKPLAENSGQIRNIIRLQRRHRAKITVNLYREYDKSHQKVRRLIKSGKFGPVQRVNCYYGKGLRNMGAHILSYLLGTLGRPGEVRVLAKRREKGLGEFTYDAYMEFGGVPVTIQGCDFNNFRLFEMDFIMEKGRIQILNEGLTIKIFRKRKNRAESDAFELKEYKQFKSTVGKALFAAVGHLAELCENKSKAAMMPPEKYLRLQLLMEKIEKYKENF